MCPCEGGEQLARQALQLPVVASVATAPVPEPTLTLMLTLRLVPPRPGPRDAGGAKLVVLPVEARPAAALLPCPCDVDGAKLAELPVEAGQVAGPLCLDSLASACSLSASVANGLCRTVDAVETRLVLLAPLTNPDVVR
mmetsp:Transcript_130243/g.253687  ORF Transcript_130243/g.253687 Transcript_130243/m.253687 type:complete len:139 (+) Transcript_130243:892-1308(+)